MRFHFSSVRKQVADSIVKQTSSPKTRLVIGFVVAVLVLATAAAAAFRSKRPAPIATSTIASRIQQTPAGDGRERRKVEALPIQLKRLGFVPREITRPEGDYIFSISNQSGEKEIALELKREHGEKLQEARLEKERLRWRQKVHLTPGTYLITEANHPDWVCRIVIEKQ